MRLVSTREPSFPGDPPARAPLSIKFLLMRALPRSPPPFWVFTDYSDQMNPRSFSRCFCLSDSSAPDFSSRPEADGNSIRAATSLSHPHQWLKSLPSNNSHFTDFRLPSCPLPFGIVFPLRVITSCAAFFGRSGFSPPSYRSVFPVFPPLRETFRRFPSRSYDFRRLARDHHGMMPRPRANRFGSPCLKHSSLVRNSRFTGARSCRGMFSLSASIF